MYLDRRQMIRGAVTLAAMIALASTGHAWVLRMRFAAASRRCPVSAKAY